MPIHDLHEFITSLETGGELSRIDAPVDPVMEIAAITERVCKQADGGTALLFRHPVGSRFPVATNLFGSHSRVCRALGINDLAELTLRLQALLERLPELEFETLDVQLAALPEFNRFSPLATNHHDAAQTRMNPPDLTRFPFLQSWPSDGGADGYSRYMTLPQVVTSDPQGGTPNCGLYRVQIRGARECAIQWKPGSGADRHAAEWQRSGRPMPVAIVLGGDPVTLFSALLPLPGNLCEMTFAGFLRGTALTMVPCRSVPLQVPSGAEVVIEGYVTVGKTVMEGPFGNHSGCYSPARPAPLLRITEIYHRPDAVIPATVVGPPPMEDCRMSLAWERLLLAFLRRIVPSIVDIHFPFEWVFHQSAIISVENACPAMIRTIVSQLWALPWFSAARILIFVDTSPLPLNLATAAWKLINEPDLHSVVIRDPASKRMALDTTGNRQPGSRIAPDDDCAARITERWSEYGLA